MTPRHLPTALVLGLFDTGLSAVRSLGRHGIPVIGMDFNPGHAGFGSRFGTPKRCPHPDHQPEELLAFLLDEGRRLEQPGILLPASDAFVLFASRYRDPLSRYFRFNLPAPTIIEACVDKRLQYELAERAGCRVPRTFHVASWQEVERIRDRVRYPAFIKPCVSHLWAERFPVKGFHVRTHEEMMARFGEILPSGLKVLVQELIPGPESNICEVYAYFDRQSQPRASFTLRKIRQNPPEFGVGSMVESLEHPALLEAGLTFLRNIGYQGIASIEFKEDERDGSIQLIELNPRIGQQTILATDCGVNLPLTYYHDLLGLPLEAPKTFQTGRRWMDAQRDFKSFLAYQKRGELDLKAWLRSCASVRSFSKFAWDDPGPFWHVSKRLLTKWASDVRRPEPSRVGPVSASLSRQP